jgi:hypothetical protein
MRKKNRRRRSGGMYSIGVVLMIVCGGGSMLKIAVHMCMFHDENCSTYVSL